jgi:hypothetical protein
MAQPSPPAEHPASPAGRASTTGLRRNAKATPPRPVWCKPLLCAALILATLATARIYPCFLPFPVPAATAGDPHRGWGDASETRSKNFGRHLTSVKPRHIRPEKACCLQQPFSLRPRQVVLWPGWTTSRSAGQEWTRGPWLTARPPRPCGASWTATLVQPLERCIGSLRWGNAPTRGVDTTHVRTTPGFTCRARLNDWPPTKREGHTSAPCLVQAIVGRL